MEKIKEKLRMGQKKSKHAAKTQENVENTKSPSESNFDNTGSHSPPRSMKDILNSESKTTQFRSFLSKIDEENENNVEVLRLDFILACRKMQHLLSGTNSNPLNPSTNHGNVVTVTRVAGGSTSAASSNMRQSFSVDVVAVKALGTEMLENFFHPNIQSRMVQLENSALRKKCGNELGNIAMSSAGNMIPDNSLSQLQKTVVHDGQYDALKKIEPLHQHFLRNRQRGAGDVIQNLQNCIL